MKSPTIPGKHYIVRSKTGCTVTQETSPGNYITASIPADEDTPVFAHTGKFDIDDDGAIVTEVFNLAPYQKLRLLGVVGGNSGLPTGYTRLEYIESTGTQYIDTGILPKGSFRVQFSVLSRVWDGYNVSNPVFFSFESNKWYFYSLNWQGIYGTAGQRGYGKQRYSLAYPPMHELDVRYDVVLDGAKTIRNGVEIGSIGGTFEYEDFEFSRISILLLNRTDDRSKPTSKVLYNFSIDDNGVPVINYIPALNPEGQPGMYDTVSKVFKTNIGTGDFLYPGKETEATTYSLRRPRMYAKLSEHGLRRLYHVPKGYNGTTEDYASENGFKILVETPMPEEGNWTPLWKDREDCIELEWVETEPPMEENFNQPE